MNTIPLEGVYTSKFSVVYEFSLFIYLINSMHPWFLLSIPNVWVSLFFLVITIIAYGKNYFNFRKRKSTIVWFLLMFVWITKDYNIFGILEGFLNAFLFASLLSLSEERILSVLSFVTKMLALLVGVSMIGYVLKMVGVPLPHSYLSFGSNSFKDGVDNYYTFISMVDLFGHERFQSVFLEPGYLTLGVAPLLFINKYNFRNKYVLVLLGAQILSFSLAGYALLLFGYLYHLFIGSKGSGRLRAFYGLFLVLILGVFVFQFVGSSFLQDTLFRRIEIVDGDIVGDNRSSIYLDSVYDKIMHSNKKWFGEPFDVTQSEKGVSGYKLFAVENGIIGVILVVLAYFSAIGLKSLKLDYKFGFILLCLLMLYQNAYPYAICILFPGACSIYALDDSKIPISN